MAGARAVLWRRFAGLTGRQPAAEAAAQGKVGGRMHDDIGLVRERLGRPTIWWGKLDDRPETTMMAVGIGFVAIVAGAVIANHVINDYSIFWTHKRDSDPPWTNTPERQLVIRRTRQATGKEEVESWKHASEQGKATILDHPKARIGAFQAFRKNSPW